MDLDIGHQSPTVAEFVNLRAKVSWGDTDKELAEYSLKHSLFHCTVRQGNKLVAMGRVIGDGALFFYIQDMVVDPDFQGLGLGKIVMDQLEMYLQKAAKPGATIGLLAAKGKEGFYQQYHYQLRPSETLGMGMCKFV